MSPKTQGRLPLKVGLRRWRRLGAQVVGPVCLALCGVSHAQFSRYADEIEMKRLDFHPQGSFRRETGTQFYGVLDQALVWRRDVEARHGCGTTVLRGAALQSLSASHLGVRSTERLDAGWLAHLKLEHGFEPGTGMPADECPRFFGRGASVGLSHRRWGRLDVGRQDHPAWLVALLSDPWGGSAVASPGNGNYYIGRSKQHPLIDSRSDRAITYTSPDIDRLTLQAQGTAAGQADGSGERGWAVHWRGGGLSAAIGWQRWNNDTRAWPLALAYTFATWRGHAGYTQGQDMGKDFRNLFIGATLPDRSGPWQAETRLGLNLHRADGEAAVRRLSAGRVWPWSRRTAWQAELSVDAVKGKATQVRLGLGVRHAFTL